jgi:hypothetical protein
LEYRWDFFEIPVCGGQVCHVGDIGDITFLKAYIGGSQRQIAVTAPSVFCYLGSREFGLTVRQLSQALGLTPAAMHYAIVRGETFLRKDKEREGGLNKYLKNLTAPR